MMSASKPLRSGATPETLDSAPMASISDAELEKLHAGIRHEARKTSKRTTASIQSFDTIEAAPVQWLWPGRIALRKLTIFAGDPGTGKSQASLDVAARLSIGNAFPDGAPSEIGDTLILTTEDDADDTIRPRLDALGADLEKIHYLQCRVEGDGKRGLPTVLDLDVFRDACDQIAMKGGRLRLLIIDPILGYLAHADAHRDAEVREALAPLIALASEKEFAVLGIAHLNKNAAASAAYRLTSSIALSAISRAVWFFVRDQENPEQRLFLCMKNNLAIDSGGLTYQIQQAENGYPRIVWTGTTDANLVDAMAPPKRERELGPDQEAILELLKDEAPKALQTKEIAERVGKGKPATSNLLSKLYEKKLVQKTGYGLWQVSAPTEHKKSTESAESPIVVDVPLPSQRDRRTLVLANSEGIRLAIEAEDSALSADSLLFRDQEGSESSEELEIW